MKTKDSFGSEEWLYELQIEETLDGSFTLYIPSLDEHYHSVNGAEAESRHVFIDAGLMFCKSESPVILEVGMGTGLNVILTAEATEETKRKITYHGFEKHPLPENIVHALAQKMKNNPKRYDLFRKIHDAPWDKQFELSSGVIVKKIRGDIVSKQLNTKYDIIYFDAFAPSRQPELWSETMLGKVLSAVVPGGIFVTYSATGSLKRILNSNGFTVESLQGATGKREMVRGLKKY